MSRSITADRAPSDFTTSHSTMTTSPAYQAYMLLYVGFAALPIVAGIDKFFHFLVNWADLN